MSRAKNMAHNLLMEHSWKNIYSCVLNNDENIAAEYQMDGKIKTMTYRQYDEKINYAARKIKNIMGNSVNRFIGYKVENRPEWPIGFWAILKSGNNPLLLDAKMDIAGLAYLMGQANAVTLIAPKGTVVNDDVILIETQELFVGEDSAPLDESWGNQIAFCTSGTTATSKVFVYDGAAIVQQLLSGIDRLKEADRLQRLNRQEKALAFLPFHHIFGFVVVFLWTSLWGSIIVYPASMVPEVLISTCREHRVTQVLSVPIFFNGVASTVLKKVKKQGEKVEQKLEKALNLSIKLQKALGRTGQKIAQKVIFAKYQNMLFGTDIHMMISGGGSILPETLRLFNAMGYFLINGFGMTEALIVSAAYTEKIDDRLNGSVGNLFSKAEIKLVSLEGSAPDVGQLLLRSPYMHIGRMVDGKLEPRDLSNGGWFDSGDIARMEGSHFYLEGRIKDVIVNESGENIYPDEIENKFLNLPGVKISCVVGIKTPNSYEEVTLIIELEEPNNDVWELAEAVASINTQLPINKKVRRVLVARIPLPLANGIKVQRQKVKKQIESNHFEFDVLDLTTRQLASKEEKKTSSKAVDSVQAQEIKKEIRAMFAEVLVMNESDISDDAHFITDLGGDSLSSLSMLAKAEEKYNILFSDNEYFSCATVNELTQLVMNKLNHVSTVKPEEDGPKKQITRFEDTQEYKEFMQRVEHTNELVGTFTNPYFVAHDSPLRDTSMIGNREVINFGSYNYLGMSGHPETMQAAKDAIDQYGTSASGSRLLAGEKTIHKQLEKAIADWKHTEDAIVLVGGHSTNVTFVGNFCTKNDLILYDALSHNSITQGCRLSLSDSKAFPHNDLHALETLLKQNRHKYEKVLIVIEGVYSMDGDIAPVPEFVRLKKQYGCFLMVDEAHSGAAIGKGGCGMDAYFNLAPDDIDIKMGTLSKGLGTCGGYLAGKHTLIEYLRYNVPGFVFSVGISPPLAAATMKAIEIIQRDDFLVERLQENITCFVEEAHKRRFNTCLAARSPIAPILIGGDVEAFQLSSLLCEQGVFVPPAVYPAVPKGQARLRFCLITSHKKEQIIYALGALDQLIEETKLPVIRKDYSK